MSNEFLIKGVNIAKLPSDYGSTGFKMFKGSILNNVEIGRNCLIGANTLLTEGTIIPDNSLVMGSPGKVKKEVQSERVCRPWPSSVELARNVAAQFIYSFSTGCG
mgnify:CR=1 FL=1